MGRRNERVRCGNVSRARDLIKKYHVTFRNYRTVWNNDKRYFQGTRDIVTPNIHVSLSLHTCLWSIYILV